MAQYGAYGRVRKPILALASELAAGVDGLTSHDLRGRMAVVESRLSDLLTRHELNGPVYEDLLLLKSIHARYQSHLDRRERQGR